MPKVGDKAWLWDANRREYRPGVFGPTARGHFREVTITGETRDSWIADGRKFDKRTGKFRDRNWSLHFRLYLSEREVDDHCFLADDSRKIFRALEDCRDVGKLRQIAAILGVDVSEKDGQP